jgi:hypothetical protein
MVFARLASLFGGGKSKTDDQYHVWNPGDPTAHVRFSRDRERMFDLSLTQRLSTLLAVPQADRGDGWSGEFHCAAWYGSIELPEEGRWFEGPDGFTYLRMNIPADGASFDSNSLGNLALDCLNRSAGAVLFADAETQTPGYVFPMGVIDSMMRYDDWRGDPIDLNEMDMDAPIDGSGVLLATPSAELLPPYTARAVDRYLRDQCGIATPRLQLLDNPNQVPRRSFVINRRFADLGSHEAAGAFCARLKWYLPPTRPITLLPEGWKEKDMTLLSSMY